MAPDVTAIERLPGRPVGVDPAAVEGEFTRIWRETAGDAYDASPVRLRVLNLVGIARDAAAEERWERLLEAIPQAYPCRSILARTDREASGVAATVSARCWSSPAGNRHVCSEEVLLRGGPGDGRALASAVLALLVPELPVDVWVIGAPRLRGDVVEEVLQAADRILFDSGEAEEASAAYREALAARADYGAEVRDLTWRRLADWRALVAQSFDREEALRALERLRSIEIAGGIGRVSSETMLMAGWFVSRLGLSLADASAREGGLRATLYAGTRGIELTVRPAGAAMQSVVVRTERAAFAVERHDERGHLCVREEWPDGEVRRTVAARPLDDAAVLVDALDDAGDAAVFEDAARAALSLSQGTPEATGSPPGYA